MTPVYQTIMDNKRGNCQQAVWASLLDLDLEAVPNFILFKDDHDAVNKFISQYGFEYSCYVVNERRQDLSDDAKSSYPFFSQGLPAFGDINGCYDAVVYSPGYFDEDRFYNDPEYKPVCHAVIVDRNFNIVHDPNPKYQGVKYPLADVIGYNGVIGICLYSKIAKNEA